MSSIHIHTYTIAHILNILSVHKPLWRYFCIAYTSAKIHTNFRHRIHVCDAVCMYFKHFTYSLNIPHIFIPHWILQRFTHITWNWDIFFPIIDITLILVRQLTLFLYPPSRRSAWLHSRMPTTDKKRLESQIYTPQDYKIDYN